MYLLFIPIWLAYRSLPSFLQSNSNKLLIPKTLTSLSLLRESIELYIVSFFLIYKVTLLMMMWKIFLFRTEVECSIQCADVLPSQQFTYSLFTWIHSQHCHLWKLKVSFLLLILSHWHWSLGLNSLVLVQLSFYKWVKMLKIRIKSTKLERWLAYQSNQSRNWAVIWMLTVFSDYLVYYFLIVFDWQSTLLLHWQGNAWRYFSLDNLFFFSQRGRFCGY